MKFYKWRWSRNLIAIILILCSHFFFFTQINLKIFFEIEKKIKEKKYYLYFKEKQINKNRKDVFLFFQQFDKLFFFVNYKL